jgi:hypothetical protein
MLESIEYIDTEAKATATIKKVKSLEEEITVVNQVKKFNIREMPRLNFDKSLPDLISTSAKILGGTLDSSRTSQTLYTLLWREKQITSL